MSAAARSAVRLLLGVVLALLTGCFAPGEVRAADASVYMAPLRPGGERVTPQERRTGRGALLLHGGGRGTLDHFRPFVAAAGADPLLCLIDSADEGDGEPQRLFENFAEVRLKVFDLEARDMGDAGIASELAACDGFFFGGGDPKRLSEIWRPEGRDSPALAALRRRFATAGAPVAGASAGAMIAGPMTLCECGSSSSIDALKQGKLFQAPGFALIDRVLIDAHFFARGLLGRHVVALARNAIAVGVGIDEDTAVLAPASGPWEIVGDGPVAVIEMPESEELRDIRLSMLWPGDRFDPLAGTFSVSKSRRRLDSAARRDGAAFRVKDIFAAGRIPAVLAELVGDDTPEVVGLAGRKVKLTFRKTDATEAFSDGERTSVLHMALDVER